MFNKLEIEFDAKATLAKLDLVKKDMKRIARRMMSSVFVLIRKEIRKNLSGPILKKRTGELYKNIIYKSDTDFSGKFIISKYYGNILEHGANILPKKGNYLTFKIGDQWIKSKGIILQARPFSKPIVDDYFSGNKASNIMDKTLQKELDKMK